MIFFALFRPIFYRENDNASATNIKKICIVCFIAIEYTENGKNCLVGKRKRGR